MIKKLKNWYHLFLLVLGQFIFQKKIPWFKNLKVKLKNFKQRFKIEIFNYLRGCFFISELFYQISKLIIRMYLFKYQNNEYCIFTGNI